MYRILDESENGSVGIRVEGKLSTEEYDLLNAYLEHLMQEVGPINFLCDMATGEGENGQALWEEMTDHLRNVQNYQRIAVVGSGDGWRAEEIFLFPGPVLSSNISHQTRPTRPGIG